MINLTICQINLVFDLVNSFDGNSLMIKSLMMRVMLYSILPVIFDSHLADFPRKLAPVRLTVPTCLFTQL